MLGSTGYVNGRLVRSWQVIVEREMHVEYSMGPKADELWSCTDAARHFHAYDRSDTREHYPTLLTRVEVVPCDHAEHDPDCDGANVTHSHCRICDEEVTPGLIPGPHSIPVAGLWSWEAKVTMPADEAVPLVDTIVSLRLESGDGSEMFGHALAKIESVTFDRAVTVTFVGVTALGRSRAGKRAKASV